MNTRRPLAVLLLLTLLAFVVAGCGGDDAASADSDPQELLSETFDSEGAVDSGVLDISVTAVAEGEGGGNLTGSLSGPFQSTAEDAPPLIDMTAALKVDGGGDNIDFSGGLTITEDGAYVTSDGTAYQVDDPTFELFKQAFSQSAGAAESSGQEGGAIFGQLGIDPSTWITDLSNEGTEEVGGAETVHLSGTADIAKLLEDSQAISQATGQATGVDAGQLDQLAGAVETSQVDIYTGVDDRILRRLDLNLVLSDPSEEGPLELELSIGISGVNEEQTIEAPADPQPIEELVPGGLGAIAAGGALPEAGIDGGTGGSGGSGGGSGSGADAGQEYLDCVAEAGSDPEAINACAELLN